MHGAGAFVITDRHTSCSHRRRQATIADLFRLGKALDYCPPDSSTTLRSVWTTGVEQRIEGLYSISNVPTRETLRMAREELTRVFKQAFVARDRSFENTDCSALADVATFSGRLPFNTIPMIIRHADRWTAAASALTHVRRLALRRAPDRPSAVTSSVGVSTEHRSVTAKGQSGLRRCNQPLRPGPRRGHRDRPGRRLLIASI